MFLNVGSTAAHQRLIEKFHRPTITLGAFYASFKSLIDLKLTYLVVYRLFCGWYGGWTLCKFYQIYVCS